MKKNLTHSARQWLKRSIDHEINIAVTGFSNSGKTTFITSVIHQLIYANKFRNLPFWHLLANNRLNAAKIVNQQYLTIKSFKFQSNSDRILFGQWPDSTCDLSTISVELDYCVDQFLIEKITPSLKFKLNFFDFPGEWLGDLEMLSMSYEQWSESCNQIIANSIFHTKWKEHLELYKKESIDVDSICACFKSIQHELKNNLISILPGRFLVPGEYTDLPILEFVPTINSQSMKLEQVELHKQRYNEFVNKIIKPFFDLYFKKIDRQVILLDLFELLKLKSQKLERKPNHEQFDTKLRAIYSLLNYGRSNIINRLISPKIDKTIIAATKADLVPKDQLFQLEEFFSDISYHLTNELKFNRSNVVIISLASIKSCESVQVKFKSGDVKTCLQGVVQGENKIIYPGDFASVAKGESDYEYQLHDFSPMISNTGEIAHIRMGKLIEELIGDKFL